MPGLVLPFASPPHSPSHAGSELDGAEAEPGGAGEVATGTSGWLRIHVSVVLPYSGRCLTRSVEKMLGGGRTHRTFLSQERHHVR